MATRKEFNLFRFDGLEARDLSNKYMTMNRVTEEKNKIVVKVGGDHLMKTKYGYALILDNTHVVFVKDWQVDCNFFQNEVLLTRDFWNVKEWGTHDNFEENEKMLDFDFWVTAALIQQEERDEDGDKVNKVRWSK